MQYVAEELSAEELELKVRALSAHVSQFGRDADFATFAFARLRAEDGRAVERFRRVSLEI